MHPLAIVQEGGSRGRVVAFSRRCTRQFRQLFAIRALIVLARIVDELGIKHCKTGITQWFCRDFEHIRFDQYDFRVRACDFFYAFNKAGQVAMDALLALPLGYVVRLRSFERLYHVPAISLKAA